MHWMLLIWMTGPAVDPLTPAMIQDARIVEASGIVASHRHPNCFYVHNDSGDSARVFLVHRTGRTRCEIVIRNAVHVDWEDIALVPGAEGAFDVCVADIGDNKARRAEVTFYRFPEPAIPNDTARITVDATRYRARYADGPVNAEGFVVHPRTSDGYLFSKHPDGHADIFRLEAPWSTKRVNLLKRVATLREPPPAGFVTTVTGADISLDGRRLVTRSYLCGWERILPANVADERFVTIFAQPARRIPLTIERQAEAICYDRDTRTFVTISEKTPTQLNFHPVD